MHSRNFHLTLSELLHYLVNAQSYHWNFTPRCSITTTNVLCVWNLRKRHLHNMMPQENTAVMILFMKHRMQIMQYISKFLQQTPRSVYDKQFHHCLQVTITSIVASTITSIVACIAAVHHIQQFLSIKLH